MMCHFVSYKKAISLALLFFTSTHNSCRAQSCAATDELCPLLSLIQEPTETVTYGPFVDAWNAATQDLENCVGALSAVSFSDDSDGDVLSDDNPVSGVPLGTFFVDFFFEDTTFPCFNVVVEKAQPTCTVTSCGSKSVGLDDLTRTTTLDDIITAVVSETEGDTCGEPPTLTFIDDQGNEIEALADITQAGTYDVKIAYGTGDDQMTTCPGSLEVLPPCQDPIKKDLICPKVDLDGEMVRSLTTCDLPRTLVFASQTVASPPSRPDCAVDVAIEFVGCFNCNGGKTRRGYKMGCSVFENEDRDDETNDFAIVSLERRTTNLRFIIRAGNVRKTCHYCVARRPCGIKDKKENRRRNLQLYSDDSNKTGHRRLTQPRPTTRLLSTGKTMCLGSGRCKAPPKW